MKLLYDPLVNPHNFISYGHQTNFIVAFNYVFKHKILYKVKKLYFFLFFLSTNMPKGSKLSSEEQVQILTLNQVGKSSREIAHIIRRSKNVILKFLKSPKKYKKAKRKGKNPK